MVGVVIDWLPRGGHASACAEEQPATMAQKLSAKLSPKAKKALMIGGNESVVALVTMAPNADRAELERAIGALGGAVQTWDRTTAVAAVEAPAAKLGELADLDAVVYIEIGETYRP
jgi:hypothetical protein